MEAAAKLSYQGRAVSNTIVDETQLYSSQGLPSMWSDLAFEVRSFVGLPICDETVLCKLHLYNSVLLDDASSAHRKKRRVAENRIVEFWYGQHVNHPPSLLLNISYHAHPNHPHRPQNPHLTFRASKILLVFHYSAHSAMVNYRHDHDHVWNSTRKNSYWSRIKQVDM